MARHSLSKRMSEGHFVPPSASLGVFGHVGDSCGFVSRRNCPPPESDSFGSFIYLPVRWRAILFPNESAEAIPSHQVLVWAFLGILGTRADSCRDGIVRHPRLSLFAALSTSPSNGVPFYFLIDVLRLFRPAKC